MLPNMVVLYVTKGGQKVWKSLGMMTRNRAFKLAEGMAQKHGWQWWEVDQIWY